MSGQRAAESHPAPRRDVHSNRGHWPPPADVRRAGQSHPGPGIRHAASRPSGRSTIGAAQQRWPEYNRFIILCTAIAGAAAFLLAAVMQVVR